MRAEALDLGIDSLFENHLLIFFELFTVFQTLVLVLIDALTSQAGTFNHGTNLLLGNRSSIAS
jgi:hypothetical protein